MKAFHGEPRIKEFYLTRVLLHQSRDEIVKGQYWESGKGCAVGCTLHGGRHSSYETELGIPYAIALLQDRLFENLPLDLAKTWPSRFLESIHTGSDLSLVSYQFISRLLTDPLHGVIPHTKGMLETLQKVANLLRKKAAGSEVNPLSFLNAGDAGTALASIALAAIATTSFDQDDVSDASMIAAIYPASVDTFVWQSELLLELLKETK